MTDTPAKHPTEEKIAEWAALDPGPCDHDSGVCAQARITCHELDALLAAARYRNRLAQMMSEEWYAQYRENYDRIGAALDPIRKKRSTGEPARSDPEEIELLVKRFDALLERAVGMADRRDSKTGGLKTEDAIRAELLKGLE